MAGWSASSAATASGPRRSSASIGAGPEPDRRARLLGAKLAALVDAAFGAADRRAATFNGGAALLGAGTAWVLADVAPHRALGPALAWASRHGAGELHLIVDDPAAAGLLARRASLFASPPAVWLVEGGALVAAHPAPLPPDEPPPAEAAAWAEVLLGAGCEVVVEHGVLRGEVHGLEVARVVGNGADTHLEVGVGRFDREAHALVSADRPTAETLAAVVAQVRAHRRPDAPPHPLKQLAAERWLRARIIRHPGLVGAADLRPVAPTVPPPDLRTPTPAPAVGTSADGTTALVVVCSTGVDLDLVPAAADARLAHAPGAALVLAVPEGDDHPVTRALAAALSSPARVLVVPPERVPASGGP